MKNRWRVIVVGEEIPRYRCHNGGSARNKARGLALEEGVEVILEMDRIDENHRDRMTTPRRTVIKPAINRLCFRD